MQVKTHIEWVKNVEGEFAHEPLWARFTELAGLKITGVAMSGESLDIRFDDGRWLSIADGGQSCCESRYMTCDDDLSGHEGGSLLAVDMDAAGPPRADTDRDEDDDYGDSCHEQQFVKVQTTKGSFTVCTHNEHNGYYGGFSLTMKLHR